LDIFTHLPMFVDLPDMSETERSPERTVTEKIVSRDGRVMLRQTRIAVRRQGAILGNCRHTFEVRFRGRGGGGKLVLVPPRCIIPQRHLAVFTYELPKEPWKLVVEPGAAYAFVFDGDPDPNGEVTVVISEARAGLVEDPNSEQANTFRDVLVEPS
jgi:hypothetical protein